MSETEPLSCDEVEDRSGGISRRTLLATGAASALVGAGVGVSGAALLHSRSGGPQPWLRPDRSDAPRVGGLHLQFGADASSEVVVSWFTEAPINNPRAMLGMPGDGFGRTVQAETRTHRDAKSEIEVRVNHARITNLPPATDYIYAAVHDGTSPQLGTVRTAPRGRSAFRFTSFGDQSTPALNNLSWTSFTNDSRGSPAAGDMTGGVAAQG